MLRRAVIAAVALLFLVCAGAAPGLVFPALTGRVVDDAGILDAATRADLTQTLAALEAKTTDQVVVVTLKSLQGTSIEDYGYQLGRAWKIGQKDKNDGLLLIVVPSERRVRIEVGYGLEGTVTDAMSRLIIENSIIPRFKTGDYPGGIKRGIDDIVQALTGDNADLRQRAEQNVDRAAPKEDKGSSWPTALGVLAFVGLLIFCALVQGFICQIIFQILFMILSSAGRGSSSSGGGGGGGFSGGGGSFGGGGASGSW